MLEFLHRIFEVIVLSLVACLVVFAPLACRDSELSRSEAKQLINGTSPDTVHLTVLVVGPTNASCTALLHRLRHGPKFDLLHPSLVLWPALVDSGLVSMRDTGGHCELQLSPRAENLQPSQVLLTPGSGYDFAAQVREFPFAIVQAGEITGIVFTGDPPSEGVAEFKAALRPLMPMDSTLVNLGDQQFQAAFTKYDDGWRLSRTNLDGARLRINAPPVSSSLEPANATEPTELARQKSEEGGLTPAGGWEGDGSNCLLATEESKPGLYKLVVFSCEAGLGSGTELTLTAKANGSFEDSANGVQVRRSHDTLFVKASASVKDKFTNDLLDQPGNDGTMIFTPNPFILANAGKKR